MPEGIVATVDDGFATLDFVDVSLRGPSLRALIDIGGAESIETITRVGPRRMYRVPVGNAVQAGLIDGNEGPAVRSAGHDTGAAAALKAADPNTNPGPDGANWHHPVDQYTSANAYVGTTSAADERALAPPPQQFPDAVGSSHGGGNAGEVPPHRDVIDYVKGVEDARRGAGDTPPDPDPGNGDGDGDGGAGAQGMSVAGGPVAGGNYPDGEPSEDWKRSEIDAYAAAHGIDTSHAPNKAAALDMIK